MMSIEEMNQYAQREGINFAVEGSLNLQAGKEIQCIVCHEDVSPLKKFQLERTDKDYPAKVAMLEKLGLRINEGMSDANTHGFVEARKQPNVYVAPYKGSPKELYEWIRGVEVSINDQLNPVTTKPGHPRSWVFGQRQLDDPKVSQMTVNMNEVKRFLSDKNIPVNQIREVSWPKMLTLDEDLYGEAVDFKKTFELQFKKETKQ